MRLRLALCLALLASPAYGDGGASDPAAPAAAPEPVWTVERAADSFLAWWREAADGERAHLPWQRDVDYWLVAEELLARGEEKAAQAFADWTYDGRFNGIYLRSYVWSRAGKPALAERKTVQRAEDLLGRASHAEALSAAAGIRTEDPVLSARARHAEAHALRGLGRAREAMDALMQAAEAARGVGWFERSLACLEEALALVTPGKETGVQADLLLGSGTLLTEGNYPLWRIYPAPANPEPPDASQRIEQALRIYERLGARAKTADAWVALYDARIGGSWGDPDEMLWAQPRHVGLLERALAIRRDLGDKAGEIQVLDDLAESFEQAGEARQALAYLRAAVDLREGTENPKAIAEALKALAEGYRKARDRVNELRVLKRLEAVQARSGTEWERHDAATRIVKFYWSEPDVAIERVRALLGGAEAASKWFYAGIWAEQLGALLLESGRPREAVEPLRRVAASLHAHEPGEYQEQYVLARLAEAHEALGEFEEAIRVRSALLRFEEKDPRPGPKIGVQMELTALSGDHFRLGRLDRALELLASAPLQEARAPGGFVVLPICVLRGRICLAQGDPEGAMEQAHEVLSAATLHEGDRDAAVEGGSRGWGDQDVLAGAVEVGTEAALRLSDPAGAAFFLERGRANVLSAFLGAQAVTASVAAPEALAEVEARARAQVAATARALREARERPNPDRAELRERQADAEAAEETLRRVGLAIQRARTRDVDEVEKIEIPGIQATLASGDAMVLYGVFPEETVALVVRPEDARVLRVGKTAEIEAARLALRVDGPDREAAPAIERLRALLVGPLGLGGEVSRVLVSPDGALAQVPFSVLLEGREIACVPSGTAYDLLRREATRTGTGTSVLALGDPDYQSHADRLAIEVHRPRSGGRLMRLPATADEARAVGESVLLGGEATETRLEKTLATRTRWRAVHLACHGLLDLERPMSSSLALTPTATDDGFLTAADVLRMQIPADLVALSACETGQGRMVRGEGSLGLTRAFMFAGAPRVICSLWKVDDEATRALMTKFYALWNPKDGSKPMGTAAALRDAQEFVRSQERWRHPYYWAAWVLWGLPD